MIKEHDESEDMKSVIRGLELPGRLRSDVISNLSRVHPIAEVQARSQRVEMSGRARSTLPLLAATKFIRKTDVGVRSGQPAGRRVKTTCKCGRVNEAEGSFANSLAVGVE